jgi:aminopeptidase N
MDQSGRRSKLLKDYAPPDYVIDEVALDFALDPNATRVSSKLNLRPTPSS